MNRLELINFIKTNDRFYSASNLSGHSDDQLRVIKIRIEKKKVVSKKAMSTSKIQGK